MPITLNGDTGIVTPMYNGSITANAVTPSVNMKNRIINGAMVIDQRNAGASVTPASGATYTLDRWHINGSQSSKVSIQQDAGAVTPPAGFSDYLGATSTSAYTVLTSDYLSLRQSIEGYNMADLNWGSANAKTVTLSFWVRSSGLTYPATFGGTLNNSAYNRSYPFTYTISAANTWEYKTITIAGDTSGTWQTTTNTGVNVGFQLGTGASQSGAAGSWSSNAFLGATGATNIIATNGATFYITGVQLEVGSTATSFDTRDFTTELSLCQRYYESTADIGTLITAMNSTYRSNCSVYSTSTYFGPVVFKVYKRAVPTVTFYYSTNSASLSAYTTSGVSTVGADPQNISQSGCNGTLSGITGFSFVQGNWVASAEL